MFSLVEKLFFKKKNPLQDLLSSLIAVNSTNKRNQILTSHMTFKLPYNQIYQMKPPVERLIWTIFSNQFGVHFKLPINHSESTFSILKLT